MGKAKPLAVAMKELEEKMKVRLKGINIKAHEKKLKEFENAVIFAQCNKHQDETSRLYENCLIHP